MDQRLTPAPAVEIFATSVRPVAGVLAFYAGGSLATGDFRPGISDLDLVAVVERPLSPAARRDLLARHESFAVARDDAAKLHCAYVPRHQAAEIGRKHLWWAHGTVASPPVQRHRPRRAAPGRHRGVRRTAGRPTSRR